MELKDFLNSINQNKKNLMEEDPNCEREYLPYITNRCLSYFNDTIFYANQMNIFSYLDKRMQYDYLRSKIAKKNRFSKWHKAEENSDIDLVKEYYGYSTQKAKDALRVLTKEELDKIKEMCNKGGAKKSKS